MILSTGFGTLVEERIWENVMYMQIIKMSPLSFEPYPPSIEPGLKDPSPIDELPKRLPTFTDLVLLERGCELLTENSVLVVVGTSSSLSGNMLAELQKILSLALLYIMVKCSI